MTKPDIGAAIVELATRKAEPGQPINLYDIGPTLVQEMKFGEQEVADALFALQERGEIQLLPGNRIVVLQAKK